MLKKRQPARMGKYANLANRPKKTVRKSSKRRRNKYIDWFWNLSRKKKVLVIATPILLFLIMTPIITYAIYARDISDQERLMNRNNTGIVLNDIHGTKFYSVGKADHRKLVQLEDISDNMEHALIASEDKDFYKHGGFNLFSIMRAAFTRVGGGSTITQQLAKNTLLSDERSFMRKYQELAMSVAIEQSYSKDEILMMYLNSVYYGENAFGIDEAARAYFNKSPKDLTVAESAMLVGLLPAPSAYSPISGNKEYAKQRQSTVLSRMVTTGYITSEQKDVAAAEELVYGEGASKVDSKAPHFAEMVINQLSEEYTYEKVMRSGYQVTTTLDLGVQDIMNDQVAKGMPHINAMGGSNASAVVIDPKTGEVRGLVGSADYTNDQWGKVNMVTTARQPGSSFKPIYYAHALADGAITPATVLHDKPTDFGGGYKPLNADKRFRGDISARRALSQSLNIPSVEVMQKYSIAKSVEGANSLGISTVKKDNNYGLALALGAAEAPLMQMTNAYAAFANGGQQYQPSLIHEVKDKFNKQIKKNATKPKQAISKQGAYLISSMLSDNNARAPIFGGSLSVSGRTIAVKTGTTDDSRDALTIGYNPQYAVGVWVGNNDNTAMRSGGSDMAGPIWRGAMTRLLQGQPNVEFEVPDGIVRRLACANGGLASSQGAGTFNEYFMAGALPTESCAPPVMVEVCNLDTMEAQTIEESQLESGNYTKDMARCEKMIQACDLSTGTVVTINEKDFNTTDYSRDTTDCKPETTTPEKVSACDTTTGKVAQVYPSQIDGVRYTTNVSSCTKSTSPTPAPPPSGSPGA